MGAAGGFGGTSGQFRRGRPAWDTTLQAAIYVVNEHRDGEVLNSGQPEVTFP